MRTCWKKISFRVQFTGAGNKASGQPPTIEAEKQIPKGLHVENLELPDQDRRRENTRDATHHPEVVHPPNQQSSTPDNVAHQDRVPKVAIKYHIRQRPRKGPAQTAHDRQDWAQSDETPHEVLKTLKKLLIPVLNITKSIRLAKIKNGPGSRNFLFGRSS